MNTVADQFAETLAIAGVKRIYGIVGDSLNGLTDAIRRQGKIEWLHVRHEEVAAFAAGAEAHLTGELAVCAGSCGPGNLHLINGLFDCHRSRVPVLAIAAHIPSWEIGADYFQETHPQTLFQECSHYCELISGANQMPRVLEVAMREALGKRGVSVVVIPGDIALQPAAPAAPPKLAGLLPPGPVVTPARQDIDKLAALLNRQRPGDAALWLRLRRRAQRTPRAWRRAQGADGAHDARQGTRREWDKPFDVGMTGLIGFASGYYAMLDCDVLLMLGTDFPYRQFYPQGGGGGLRRSISAASRSAAGVRRSRCGGRCARDDCRRCCRCSSRNATTRTDAGPRRATMPRRARGWMIWRAASQAGGRSIRSRSPGRSATRLPPTPCSPAMSVLPTVWAARYLAMNGKRRLLGSFWHGSMANAMAQAIGAQAAYTRPSGRFAIGRRRVHHADGRPAQPEAA